MELRDYRPICLVGYLYKLLAKIMVNPLKSALPRITSPFQGAFMANRQILDSVLVTNELIDSRRRSKVEGVVHPPPPPLIYNCGGGIGIAYGET